MSNDDIIGTLMPFSKLDSEDQSLVSKAVSAANYSYSPYSQFKVGCALKTKDGQMYTGCNVESISFAPSICAERTAIVKAVSEGQKWFDKIAIAADSPRHFTPPCGVCRQHLSEFCPDLKIILTKFKMDEVVVTSLKQMFPMAFSPANDSL